VRRIALAAALLAACSPDRPGAWAPVTRGDLVLGVEVQGAMRATDSTPVKPPAIGNIWEVKIAEMAPEGDAVKAGDVVVRFDASDMMRLLQEAQNDVESAAKSLEKQRHDGAMSQKDLALEVAQADAGLRKATLKSDRAPDLTAMLDLKVAELDRRVAELDLEHARNAAEEGLRHDAGALERLGATLRSAQSRVAEIQANIARMSVAAPRAGTVVYPTSGGGEKKKVGDSIWRAETALEVASLDRMVGDGEIDEVDSSRVTTAQPVSLRLDAHPDTELTGRVHEVARIVQTQSRGNPSRVVRIEIELDPTGDLAVRPGMRFRGRVETGRVTGAVLVPVEAVFIERDGPVAYRRDGDGHARVRLEVGRRSDVAVEVLSGLAPGDQVSRVRPEGDDS
jgi:multidrug efflux pump subunit AcrA (membrane-fusion protein)